MKLVLKIKLLTDEQTDRMLRQTAEQYQQVCNFVSQAAFENHTFTQVDLHHLVYYPARAQFAIPSQLVVRAIATVCSSYKTLLAQIKEHNRTCTPAERRELTRIEFKPNTALSYDERVMRLDANGRRVSLRTLCRRVWFAFEVGQKREPLLEYAQGQADLKRYGKVWYLFQTLVVPEAAPVETTDFVGVDVGICTVASANDGQTTQRFEGAQVRRVRHHYSHLRRGLQRHNTKSSRRRVRQLRDKEARRVRTLNHLISRRIVEQAQRTNATIVLEDLAGIRGGVKVPKSQRYERFSWSYAQLQQMIVYKAQLAGISVLFVPADYTSKTCSRCHYMADGNRPTQAWFQCRECGFCWHADDNAACNIRFLGAASACQKRAVSMQEYLHTDRRKPLRSRSGR